MADKIRIRDKECLDVLENRDNDLVKASKNGNMTSEIKTRDEERLKDLENRVRDNGLVKVSKTGTQEELKTWYSRNAEEYHELNDLAKYDVYGCRALAKALAEWVPNTEARIIDVAAGTGVVGRQLRKLNYTNIDALEPSEGMIKLARAENIYNDYITDIITPHKQINVKNETYDALCIGGAVLTGHISLDSLPELMRITKKGGVIVFNVGEKFLTTDPEFQNDRHHRMFQKYVENGQFVKWDHFKAPYRYTEDCIIYRIVVA